MGLFDFLLGGPSSAEKGLQAFSTAGFGSRRIQNLLPAELRAPATGPLLGAGIQGIGNLLRRPGSLSPTVSEAILPRLGMESENIAQNFQGIQANQAGAAARENLPVSIKNALASALDVAQERAQRGARQQALAESGQLQRSDLERVFQLLNALFQFSSGGRGQAIEGLGAASGLAQRRQAAQLQFIGSLLSGLAPPGAAAAGAPKIAGVAQAIP